MFVSLPKKREVKCWVHKNTVAIEKLTKLLPAFLLVCSTKQILDITFFLVFKVVKQYSGYDFHYLLISSDTYSNRYFWEEENLSSEYLSTHIWSFFKIVPKRQGKIYFLLQAQYKICLFWWKHFHLLLWLWCARWKNVSWYLPHKFYQTLYEVLSL